MVSPITDTPIIGGQVDVVMQQTLLRQAKSRCAHFAGTMSAMVEFHRGTFTAKWRRYENITPTVTALTELNGNVAFPTRDAIQPTITDITAAVSKYGQHFIVNEEVVLERFNMEADELARVLGISAGRSLCQLQRNEMEDNSTQRFSNGTATANVNTKIDQTVLRKAVNFIERNDGMRFTPMSTGARDIGTVPIESSFWGICHPDVRLDVEDITGFVAVEKYAGQTQIAPGEFGAVEGIRFIGSTECSINAGSGAVGGTNVRETTSNADVYDTVIYGDMAIGSLGFGMEHIQESYQAGDELPAVLMIAKPLGSAGAADPFDELSSLAWKSWHAAKVLNANWTVNVQSAATDYS